MQAYTSNKTVKENNNKHESVSVALFIVSNGLLSYPPSFLINHFTMRIRKHAKSLTTNNILVQAYVCQLNQSPWDVITNFSPPSSPPLSPPHQVHENSNTSDGIIDDDSVLLVKREEVDKVTDLDLKSGSTDMDEVTEVENEGALMQVLCCKNDGKNWQCPREAISGNSMCEHHLSLANNRKIDTGATVAEVGKRRAGTKNASSSSMNPYEFYYYSGFGPRWGRKRGDDEKVDNVVCKSTLSQFIDEDLEDEDGELCERKRARKPIKARSLKSLM